jgi:hypothetical protein
MSSRAKFSAASLSFLALLGLVAGCKPQVAPGEQPPAQPQPLPKTKVTAWINVTSGCQQPTVDLLKQLSEQYKDRVELEIVDFGQADGARRWHEAGLNCMTIQFDGNAAVAFPQGKTEKVVVFQMPAGFNWGHEDLMAAFMAAAMGTLRPATEQELKELMAPRQIELSVCAQEVRDLAAQGKPYGQLIVGDQVVARVYGRAANQSPAQRCRAAQLALEKWLSKPVLPSDLSVAESANGWGLYANEDLILLATQEDAKAYGKGITPRQLATLWLSGLRTQVIRAGAEAREKARMEVAPAQQTSSPGQTTSTRAAPSTSSAHGD